MKGLSHRIFAPVSNSEIPSAERSINANLSGDLINRGPGSLDVLRWATKSGGELLGLGSGTIECGKLADLLVVDGDPSVDIGVLKDQSRLRAILKGGVFVKDAL